MSKPIFTGQQADLRKELRQRNGSCHLTPW
jgi:hypothetical protein